LERGRLRDAGRDHSGGHAVAGNIRSYVLRRADGTEIVVSIADSEQTLIDTQKAIMGTRLLPARTGAAAGTGRVELYPVLTSWTTKAGVVVTRQRARAPGGLTRPAATRPSR